jgi:hypothetical protein
MNSDLKTIKRIRTLRNYLFELKKIGIDPYKPGEFEYQSLVNYFNNIPNHPIRLNNYIYFDSSIDDVFTDQSLRDLLSDINEICDTDDNYVKYIDDLCDVIDNK